MQYHSFGDTLSHSTGWSTNTTYITEDWEARSMIEMVQILFASVNKGCSSCTKHVTLSSAKQMVIGNSLHLNPTWQCDYIGSSPQNAAVAVAAANPSHYIAIQRHQMTFIRLKRCTTALVHVDGTLERSIFSWPRSCWNSDPSLHLTANSTHQMKVLFTLREPSTFRVLGRNHFSSKYVPSPKRSRFMLVAKVLHFSFGSLRT